MEMAAGVCFFTKSATAHMRYRPTVSSLNCYAEDIRYKSEDKSCKRG
ncbi:hypothetical protein C5167_020211 [Papaver somniferum]|uniref:Uncharacterized protein n=1 Tax=Papaver somniferum TaxID=3469 RepID=A0A4Y7IVK2_PAPSO|nr:hypothetical protein C5167_020211 [Papaver somniferum]